ncbi:alpha-1,3-galactosyltransferase 2-like isoform X2 [Clupea harengus]|uniref:Alpha-1,3-galactosyltransferase 2-like isoform X2 n=1 Tax=Clupea harengus TaxID=7950 RepID=A0A6P8F4R3_CLUHA|nr:alpha-1,3-galactosyltransferase 2-like isoform X2 [Clupea harengus]
MRNICSLPSRKTALALCILTLFVVYHIPYSIRFLEGLIPMDKCQLVGSEALKLDNAVDITLKLGSRSDVQTCTYWGAPIIWDGMFDPEAYDQTHKRTHTSVALTVFAVGRYLDAYLKDFLRSAEIYFMVGLPVTYYVFTDVPEKVPALNLAPGRELKVFAVERHSRWQDISMMRMKSIMEVIDTHIRHHNQYVFCMDVDQVFGGRFGAEALGDSVALLHAYYYHRFRYMLTYDQNPKSQAYMAESQGDFYYHAAVFGGSWQRVRQMTEACYRGIIKDKDNGVEALWHDESHLNKYLWQHKPSRVLSPEYCWDPSVGYRSDIHVTRLLWREKDYGKLRDKAN